MTKWQMVPLGDVLQLQRRWVKVDPLATYEEIGVRCFGNGIFHKAPIDGSTLGNKRVLRIEPGDLVFNNVFAWEGAVAVASEAEAGKIGSHRFVTYTADQNFCSVDYLRWFFKSEPGLEVLRRVSPGSAGRNRTMSLDQLPKQVIPLPPLLEQHRVVEYLDILNTKIDEAKQLRQDAIKELRVLDDQVATTLIGDDTWPLVTMEDLVGRANLKNGISLKSSPFHSNIRCLTLSSIRNGRIDTNESKPVPMDASEAGPYLVHQNDVYVVRGNGSKDLVGRAGIVEDATDNVIFPDLLIKIPLNSSRIIPDYFITIWNSRLIRNRIEDLAKTTSGIWKVNQGHIASVQIPLPTLSVQAKIVSQTRLARLSCSDILTVQRETESELDAMLPAILGQLFNGGGHRV
jgi:type I restriction enzyme, S subunit